MEKRKRRKTDIFMSLKSLSNRRCITITPSAVTALLVTNLTFTPLLADSLVVPLLVKLVFLKTIFPKACVLKVPNRPNLNKGGEIRWDFLYSCITTYKLVKMKSIKFQIISKFWMARPTFKVQ